MYDKPKHGRYPRRLTLALWLILAISLLVFAVNHLEAQMICDVYPDQADHLRDVFGPECQNPTMVQPEYLPLQPGCMVMFDFPGLGDDLVGVITGYKWNMDTRVYEYWVLYDFPRPDAGWGGGWAAASVVTVLDAEFCDK